MGNLLVSLRNTAEAMRVFQRGLGIVQSNVTNASTPGYARQTQLLEARRLDLDWGLPGGVLSAGTLDGRSEYAEAAVRRRTEGYGYADEKTRQLELLEAVYDIGGDTGLGGALNRFFSAFSALAVAPNDIAARQVALDRSAELARSFQGQDGALGDARVAAEKSLQDVADSINRVLSNVAQLNREFRFDYRVQEDAGAQAQMNSLLEELSEMGNFTVLRADDGSAAVYLDGQTLLVAGEQQMPIRVEIQNGQAVRILDAQGRDITGQVRGGRLAALLEVRNVILPAKESELNRLAQSLADAVNGKLAAGVDLNGQPPLQGLFAFDAALGAARSLSTTPLRPEELALASASAPGGNAIALQVSELAQAKVLDGYTFTQSYATQAADVGRQVEEARSELQSRRGLTMQARQFREEIQGVSLDEEAITLLQFQRAFEASAQLVRTLNEMTETTIQMLR